MFSRVISLVGEENFKKINDLKVLVIGVGGVGSSCAMALLRSGVRNIKLVDFDKIELSNLNRQIMTNKNNIGKLKVLEMQKLLNEINEDCIITTYPLFLDSSNIKEIFMDVDYVFDCCDTVKTKKEIIKYCLEHNIKFITACGTARKMDPRYLEVVDIRKTTYDPLAKVLRNWVNKEKIRGKTMCCYSKEIGKGDKDVLSSIMMTPASCGLLMASYAIGDVIDGK